MRINLFRPWRRRFAHLLRRSAMRQALPVLHHTFRLKWRETAPVGSGATRLNSWRPEQCPIRQKVEPVEPHHAIGSPSPE